MIRRRTRRRIVDAVAAAPTPSRRLALRLPRLRRPPPRLQPARPRRSTRAPLASIAARAEQAPDDGLDGDRTCRRSTSCAAWPAAWPASAAVPVVEFTISDTFAAPVGNVLSLTPQGSRSTPTSARRAISRGCTACPDMLATVAQRHEEGARPGRTAVARLVEAAIAQLDLLIEDPDGRRPSCRADADGTLFAGRCSAAVDEHARPALAAYRDALRHVGAPHGPRRRAPGPLLPARRRGDVPGHGPPPHVHDLLARRAPRHGPRDRRRGAWRR